MYLGLTISNSNGNLEELERKINSVWKVDAPIGYFMLPLQMLTLEMWNVISICNSFNKYQCHRRVKFEHSRPQKDVNYFWQSIGAILEVVPVG